VLRDGRRVANVLLQRSARGVAYVAQWSGPEPAEDVRGLLEGKTLVRH
jgi:hypothetical protein